MPNGPVAADGDQRCQEHLVPEADRRDQQRRAPGQPDIVERMAADDLGEPTVIELFADECLADPNVVYGLEQDACHLGEALLSVSGRSAQFAAVTPEQP